MRAYTVSVNEHTTSQYRIAWDGDADSLREAIEQGEVSLDDMYDCDVHFSYVSDVVERDDNGDVVKAAT